MVPFDVIHRNHKNKITVCRHDFWLIAHRFDVVSKEIMHPLRNKDKPTCVLVRREIIHAIIFLLWVRKCKRPHLAIPDFPSIVLDNRLYGNEANGA